MTIDLGYAKVLYMFIFFHPLSWDAISNTLKDNESKTLMSMD